jgi:hypothetical protein
MLAAANVSDGALDRLQMGEKELLAFVGRSAFWTFWSF